MKAVGANLLDLLKVSHQFVVPIYQRVYSWGEAECEQLWDDVLRAGARSGANTHFTGSIVHIEREQGTITAAEPNLIIDGQQRVTTVVLMLAALAEHLGSLPESERQVVAGFAPEMIRWHYLQNQFETGDSQFKLLLSKGDRDALKAVILGTPSDLSPGNESRVLSNYAFLKSKIADPGTDLQRVCRGLSKLEVVDVSLTRGTDDPQLVFESMNSTGKKLSQADMIRNFVLMDLPPSDQEQTYEALWHPMENQFSGDREKRFDDFIRDYLTLKTGKTPRLGDIYDAFKVHAAELEVIGVTRRDLLADLSQHAVWFVRMALGEEPNQSLAARFSELAALNSSVAYPFLLRVYADVASEKLSADDFETILDAVLSYVFRRNCCEIPTNSLNKTFASLGNVIDTQNYVESILARLLTLPTYRRFPTDDEFAAALRAEDDFYHWRALKYFLGRIENFESKEPVSVSNYTIEHIMPQNEDLSDEWQADLGPGWRDVHERLLHSLGNLTLTGYNPEYSDRSFSEKRDMKDGFKDSPLRVNRGLGQLDAWNADEIERRAERLSIEAQRIWARPSLSGHSLRVWNERFRDEQGFDWGLLHSILETLPAGRWTSYHELAGAVGTSAPAVGFHVANCDECTDAHRVMTWDGRIAESFRWRDPEDDREPESVLRAEGVQFDDKHRAERDQQLVAEDLLALVGEID
jgi:uncharacterized protein with ParB-like and HNH nuclease domain/alkylated DNA nucleotide flippase Atl1